MFKTDIYNYKKYYYFSFNYSSKIKEVGYISGADCFIRKSVLQKSGIFDESIFMYGDDVDLCFRIRKSGYKIISVPIAKIMHIEHGSFETIDDKKFLKNYEIAMQGYYKFLYKYFNKKMFSIYLLEQIKNILKYIFSLLFPYFILNKIFVNPKSIYIYKRMIKINREEYKNIIISYRS